MADSCLCGKEPVVEGGFVDEDGILHLKDGPCAEIDMWKLGYHASVGFCRGHAS